MLTPTTPHPPTQPSVLVPSVLVMDDAIVVRDRIVEILVEIPGIGVILQAGDTQSAIVLIEKHQPCVIILDIQVPGTAGLRDGIDVLKWVQARYPALNVIMLSNFDIPRYRHACENAGARYFFDKSIEFEQLSTVVTGLLLPPFSDRTSE